MGLDLVEFVMSVEEAFGLAIPNADAAQLLTPGAVVSYLEGRLRPGQGVCLEQRAFHALRRAAIAVLNRPRSAFRPDTRWESVLPWEPVLPRRQRRTWNLLHHATGVVPWPKMWPWASVPRGHATMGDTARFLAVHAAGTLQPPGAGWSRAQIEAIIRRLMSEVLGIHEFEWEQKFVEDLGVV